MHNTYSFRKVFFALCLLLFTFSGCTKYGRLHEGNCIVEVSFSDIPDEIFQFDNSVLSNLSINIEMVNLTNDMHYLVTLNNKNHFSKTLHMQPGSYQIIKTSASHHDIFWLDVKSNEECIIVSQDSVAYLDIALSDANTFYNHYYSVKPCPDILSSTLFSGNIQIHGKSIPVQSLIPELSIDFSKTLLPYESVLVKDDENLISVKIYNPYDYAISYANCTLLEYNVYGNSIVLPGGIRIGSDTQTICNSREGIYGNPTKLSGNILYGIGVASGSTNLIYSDSISGDRLTLTTDDTGEYITNIQYIFHANKY